MRRWEKEALKAIVKYSQNIYELILYHLFDVRFQLLPEELESFFAGWADRIPKKSISLIIFDYETNFLDANGKNMKIIEKYIDLGVIKKFNILDFE